MAENSAISWTDHTFNPWMGCTKYGPGCDLCYAEALMDTRYRKVTWGKGEKRVRTEPRNWHQPVRWNTAPFVQCQGCGWRGDARKAPFKGAESRACPRCAGFLERTRPRVFCASLADVFDAEVDPSWRVDLFNLIAATPNLDWMLLTKRIGNAFPMMRDALEPLRQGDPGRDWLANIDIGATMVNQAEIDRDLPKLLATPARRRFISIEPMLGPVDFLAASASWPSTPDHPWRNTPLLDGIHWVIVGGESGHGARDFQIPWARSVVEQCQAADVPVHVKQLGAEPRGWCAALLHSGDPEHDDLEYCDVSEGHEGARCAGKCNFILDQAGRDLNEWPPGLRIQEFPK